MASARAFALRIDPTLRTRTHTVGHRTTVVAQDRQSPFNVHGGTSRIERALQLVDESVELRLRCFIGGNSSHPLERRRDRILQRLVGHPPSLVIHQGPSRLELLEFVAIHERGGIVDFGCDFVVALAGDRCAQRLELRVDLVLQTARHWRNPLACGKRGERLFKIVARSCCIAAHFADALHPLLLERVNLIKPHTVALVGFAQLLQDGQSIGQRLAAKRGKTQRIE